MSHNLYFNTATNKYEMMSVGATWHNLGQIVENATTWQETMELAGLDWTVSKRNLKTPDGLVIPRVFGIFRDDKENDLEGFLGSVGDKFHSIQNKQAFEFVDALMEADGGAHYEAAGSLGKGEQVFCVANLGYGFEVVDGDRQETYLLFLNPHNSAFSPKVLLTAVRPICANTIAQALAKDGKNALTLRHTKSVDKRLQQAAELMSGAKQTADTLRDKLRLLASREVRRETMEVILDKLFPKPSEEKTAAATSKRENRVKAYLEIFAENDGAAGLASIEGTAYHALNAYTNLTDHHAPVVKTAVKEHLSDAEIRASRAMFGDGATDKAAALDAILEATKFAPTRTISRTYFGADSRATQVLEIEPEATASGAGLLDAILSNPISKK